MERRDEAEAEAEDFPLLKTKLSYEPYLNCGDSWRRSLMTKLRVGTNTLNIEKGRWEKKQVHERVCSVCKTNQVEDEQHFLLECSGYDEARHDLYKDLKEEKYNIQPVIGDKKKLLNALIGEGLEGRTRHVVEIVMKYIKRINTIRKRKLEKK